MKFVADENIDYPIVLALRKKGHRIFSIIETNKGIPDEEVLDLATSDSAVLLTEDKDFGEHVFRLGSDYSGVILIRCPELSMNQKLLILEKALEEFSDKFEDSFTVIAPGKIRIRKR